MTRSATAKSRKKAPQPPRWLRGLWYLFMAKAIKGRYACDHHLKVLRRKPCGSDRFRFVYQCVTCGCGLGHQIGAKQAGEHGFTPWDFQLQESGEAISREASELASVASAKDREEWWSRYQDHLASKKWQKLRELVLKRAEGICEGCGIRPAVQVHHVAYTHMGHELLWELRAVCLPCHERIHPHMKGRP